MTIYLDSDYRCHTENEESFTPIETDFFDGKCPEYIEGFRYVPEGETWLREDGIQYKGLVIMPITDINMLKQIQHMYEGQTDMREALSILGVTEE